MSNYDEVRISLKFADDRTLREGTRSFFKQNMSRVLQQVDAELTSVLGVFWTNLKAQSSQLLAIHTILVLWRTYCIPAFQQMSSEEQNVLKWASLLHAIAKRGTPTILGRDHCHAFRSASATLQIFQKMGIWQPQPASKADEQNEQFQTVLRLISESF